MGRVRRVWEKNWEEMKMVAYEAASGDKWQFVRARMKGQCRGGIGRAERVWESHCEGIRRR